MLSFGAETVIITGFTRPDGQTGFFGMHQSGEAFSYRAQRIGKHFHGTGDLFAAVFLGSMLSGMDLTDAAINAEKFVRRCIEGTPQSTPHGVEFERFLKYL
jgi:pyridoxine kinase